MTLLAVDLVEEDLLVVFSLAVALELIFSLQGYMRVAFFSIFHSFSPLSFIRNEEDPRRREKS